MLPPLPLLVVLLLLLVVLLLLLVVLLLATRKIVPGLLDEVKCLVDDDGSKHSLLINNASGIALACLAKIVFQVALETAKSA